MRESTVLLYFLVAALCMTGKEFLFLVWQKKKKKKKKAIITRWYHQLAFDPFKYWMFYSFYFFKWAASSEFGTYRLCEQRRFRRACASAQSRQNLRCWLIQAVSQEEPSDRKPDPWPLWMTGHAQSKFVMTECSKTQIRLTGPKYFRLNYVSHNRGREQCPIWNYC